MTPASLGPAMAIDTVICRASHYPHASLVRWLAVAGLAVSGVARPALLAIAADRPAATFREPCFDFGKAVQGRPIEHDFILTNSGAAALQVEKVTMTPPLLATRVPGEVAPGAAATIRARLETSRLQGAFSGELVVHARGLSVPLATLTFEGTIVTPIEIAPIPALFVVGERGRGAESAVDIINHEARPLRIDGVAHGTEAFTTHVETLQPGQRYRLHLRLRPDGPAGKRTETIMLNTSSHATPVVRIPAQTYLRERVYVFPDVVDLGALKRSMLRARPEVLEALAQTLMVYQTNGRDFKITVDSDLPLLKLTPERGPQNDRYQIAVALQADEPALGTLSGSIRVRTNDPQFPLVVVPVTGLILDQ